MDLSRRPLVSRPTLVYIVCGCATLAAALIIGIADNVPGVSLLYVTAIIWTMAVAHRWTRPRTFFWLAGAGAFAFPLFAILHNLLYGAGKLTETMPVLPTLFEILHVTAFLVALFVAPAAVVVGLVGALVTALRRRSPDGDAPPDSGEKPPPN